MEGLDIEAAGALGERSKSVRRTYPSSKCLQRLSGSCFFALHAEHS